MSEPNHHFYEFGPFRLDTKKRRLLRDKEFIPLAPKSFQALLMLIQNSGRVVEKRELIESLWPDSDVEENNVEQIISALRKALGEKPHEGRFIKTIPRQGYRFVAVVTEVAGETAQPVEEKHSQASITAEKEPTVDRVEQAFEPQLSKMPNAGQRAKEGPFAGYLWHVVVGCTLYAALYSMAVLLEITYQFDRFGSSALKIAPLAFLWILSTSLAGLGADWTCTRRGKKTGLALSLLVFIGASLLLYAALGPFLPGHAITEASFQTYTAHGAYLKDISYFLPLAIVFLILPFHFVVSMQQELQAGKHRLGIALLTGKRWSVAPQGAIYLKVWWLGLLLFGAFVVSLALTAHLFDNLKPNVYMNLFMQLVQWRWLLYFALGLECLIWYYRSLNEIKRECLVLRFG